MQRLSLVLMLLLVACTSQAGTTATAATISSTTTTAVATTIVTDPIPGIDDLPEGLQGPIAEMIAITEELRGLEFLEPPAISVVSPDELERLVREEIEENTEDIDVDQALYELLGLVDEGTSLLQLFTDVLGEQVAGFYDSDTKQLVVPIRSDDFSPLERSTIVHELTHALTDQHFDLGATYETLIDEDRLDEAAAFQAVVEGDAVLTELMYLQRLSGDERRAAIEESFGIDTSALDAAPQFLQASLIFPYVQGFQFVDGLSQLEGVDGINRVYAERPVSTEQIITPSDYQNDQPAVVAATPIELPGYEPRYEIVWGELGFKLMFDQILGGRSGAADGWGGDIAQVFFDGEEVAMVLTYKGDTPADAEEMEAALLEYLTATLDPEPDGQTFSQDHYGSVTRAADQVVLIVASDPAAGQLLQESLVGPT